MRFYLSVCHKIGGGGGCHKYIPGFCTRHLNKSNHTKILGISYDKPQVCGDCHTFPAFTSPAFPEKFLAGSRPSATVNSSHSAFSWKSSSSSAEPASRAFVSLNSGPGVAFAAVPEGCVVLCRLWRVRAQSLHSQVGMRGFRWRVGLCRQRRLPPGPPLGLLSGTHAWHFCYLGRKRVWVKLPGSPCHWALCWAGDRHSLSVIAAAARDRLPLRQPQFPEHRQRRGDWDQHCLPAPSPEEQSLLLNMRVEERDRKPPCDFRDAFATTCNPAVN